MYVCPVSHSLSAMLKVVEVGGIKSLLIVGKEKEKKRKNGWEEDEVEEIDDDEMRGWLEKAILDGKPGPENQSMRAHNPPIMRSFTKTREWIATDGVLEKEMREHFWHVFMFAAHDEVIHTGFLPLAHYLISVGVSPKDQ